MQNVTHDRTLDLQGLIPAPLPAPLRALFETFAAGLLGLGRVERFYRRLPPMRRPCEFARVALERLGVHFEVRPREQFHIPSSGRAIVIANHPFGGVEGLFMIQLLKCLRDDVRILANFHLDRIPEFRDLFIPVNPFGGRRAARENAAGLRQALRWVKNGGLLMIFPAGEVSHFDPASRTICDPAWSPSVARLIRLAHAPVVPTYFHGRNSLRFQLAGMVHPVLRTFLLPRELLNKKGVRVPVRIGRPIPFEKFGTMHDDERLAAHLRMKTYMLAAAPADEPQQTVDAPAKVAVATVKNAAALQPVSDPMPARRLQKEIERLPEAQRLTANGDLQVLHASAQQVPWLLQEIGRLRELTFRAVGEGTGRPADIDVYDDYYEHLFVWNSMHQELVGAYRIGHADRICERLGKRGLYTSTLFDFGTPLIKQLNPALELGRSFVRPEYQKSFTALLLLWKGIGEYVARHPRYRILFGAVSISNDYAALSKEMLVQHFKRNNSETELARWVRPRRRFRGRHDLRALAAEMKSLQDIEALSAFVSDIEPDGKGVPVLVRQYLKLGGRMLGFNVDPAFANSIDCLIMVDLRQTDPRVLAKYMGGREAAEAFLELHAEKSSAVSA